MTNLFSSINRRQPYYTDLGQAAAVRVITWLSVGSAKAQHNVPEQSHATGLRTHMRWARQCQCIGNRVMHDFSLPKILGLDQQT